MSSNYKYVFALVFLSLFLVQGECRVKIGHLQTISHGVKGTVYALNKETLFIQQFTFLGKDYLKKR